MSQESTSAVESGAEVRPGIQQGLADRAEALKGVAQIRENLGQVAAGHEVHADARSRVVLTPREAEELRANGPEKP